MKPALYEMAIETFAPMLNSLSAWLDKGAAHAAENDPDAGGFVSARLTADMFPLATQVQLACHHAGDFVARICGQAAPSVEAEEETVEQLKARIAKTIRALRKAPVAAFEGAEGRAFEVPLTGDLVLDVKGDQLLRDWSLPHFYFHVVTAYDILRYNGVELGKQDFLGHIGYAVRKRGTS